ncbi:MAG: proton-conducting transporter membrane subunit [Chitinophagaceae bacterium]
MSSFLQLFILLPLAGFFISLLVPRKKESIISWIALGTVGAQLAGISVFAVLWLVNNHPILDIKHIVLYKTTGFEIFIDFFFDKVTAVFAFVGAVLTLLVTVFSRYYLHREEGFKRFFNTTLLFYAGYNLVIFSGNFETLFIGWELLGFSSFLLIAFYRDRYLPVKNGLKVISVYRLSDICLLLAMWLSHHLWHENITFLKLSNAALVQQQLEQHYVLGVLISVMLLIAAAAKSAQLPFSSWLPRAMEGPTTSSAIFYGSLSVHIGAFILLRTYLFWENLAVIKACIIITGLATSVIATSIARVQSSVKTQIAYSSIAQIGIIFIEVALGFHNLALLHFAGNAFLRTYQLLVSPSVLSYLIHDQFYNFAPGGHTQKDTAFKKISNSLYVLAVKEWNLDFLLHRFLWDPFKWIGKKFDFLVSKTSLILLSIIYLFGVYFFSYQEKTPVRLYESLPVVFSLVGLLVILKSFAERGDARKAWLMVFFGQFFIILSIILNEPVGFSQILIYLSGTIISAIAGYVCLNKIKAIDNEIDLNGFHGYSYEKPKHAVVFLLSLLGLLGFPITPTFIGVDLLFTHIQPKQYALIGFTSLSFLFMELSLLRIYARIFLGQHKKAYHPIAFRSS